MKWIEYKTQKPKEGQLVLIYRDIESRQVYVETWSEESEIWAEMNEITHWCKVKYPY